MILVKMRCKNVIFSSSVTTSQNMKQHWLFSSCSKQVVKNQQSIKQERRFASKRLQVVSLLQLYSTTIVPQLKKAHGPQPHKHRKFSNNIIEFLTKKKTKMSLYVMYVFRVALKCDKGPTTLHIVFEPLVKLIVLSLAYCYGKRSCQLVNCQTICYLRQSCNQAMEIQCTVNRQEVFVFFLSKDLMIKHAHLLCTAYDMTFVLIVW